MPEWWLEAVLPGAVFTTMFVLWIALPNRSDEPDLGSRIRRMFSKRR